MVIVPDFDLRYPATRTARSMAYVAAKAALVKYSHACDLSKRRLESMPVAKCATRRPLNLGREQCFQVCIAYHCSCEKIDRPLMLLSRLWHAGIVGIYPQVSENHCSGSDRGDAEKSAKWVVVVCGVDTSFRGEEPRFVIYVWTSGSLANHFHRPSLLLIHPLPYSLFHVDKKLNLHSLTACLLLG